MTSLRLRLTLLLGALALAGCRSTGNGDDGWIDLGSPEHWRGYQKEVVPDSWVFEDGTIHLVGGGAGDLITRESFASFELELEWKISPGGNSGIMYHVSEDQPAPYMTGPEMQVLDDAANPGADPRHKAGADYALYAPERHVARPAGEWNQARIVVRGPSVEYWLNGARQCAYELWSPEWEQRVADSKFAQWPSFGRNLEGHVDLQDHGNEVWFRALRIRRL